MIITHLRVVDTALLARATIQTPKCFDINNGEPAVVVNGRSDAGGAFETELFPFESQLI
jgi:hypothetical protein